MFAKAGIIAATTAAAALAMSPLAFAGDWHGDKDRKSHHKSHKSHNNHDRKSHHRGGGDCSGDADNAQYGRQSGGLINLQNVNAQVPVNVCDNDIVSGVLGVLSRGLTNNDNH